jgi:K+-sensing histidine kinase KdpD
MSRPSPADTSTAGTGSESRPEALARRALLASCVTALLLGPVVMALGDSGDAGAALGHMVMLFLLVLLTAWLLRGVLTSQRWGWPAAVTVLYGLLSYGYFKGLDDPSWKSPDPEADAIAVVSGALHLFVVLCCAALVVARATSRRQDARQLHSAADASSVSPSRQGFSPPPIHGQGGPH